ncbi:MAG TPA: hypothetical protein PK573_01750 [Spirochaetota bacterium]|nr:hypothetical protein [Spirochaetota bacterium]HRZ28652.1 hypothetical protein [Spirochaetota bacterium]HSA15088.1 hypothetical protein [Spirochaetota bacterium]
MNEKKAVEIFEKAISKREKSSRWSKKMAMKVLASESAAHPLPERGAAWSALYYGFSISAAAMIIAGAVFLNSVLRESFQESELQAANTAAEDFFNPYSSNNINNY